MADFGPLEFRNALKNVRSNDESDTKDFGSGNNSKDTRQAESPLNTNFENFIETKQGSGCSS